MTKPGVLPAIVAAVAALSLIGACSAPGPVTSPTATTPVSTTTPATTNATARSPTTTPATTTPTTVTPTPKPPTRTTSTPPPTISATLRPTPPTAYRISVLFRGAHPDDLEWDGTGGLLFSDYTNGTISRLALDGTVQVLHRGLAGPEGLVRLADGTVIVASELTNEISSFAPGAARPTLLRRMPGNPRPVTCQEGVDGIAYDGATRTLIVPDAPTGVVYRLSLDGRKMTTIATGFTHPTGAAVAPDGTIYVADECGGGLWRVRPGDVKTLVATIGMPDDVVIDPWGRLVVTDVRLIHHRVVALRPDGTGLTTLVSARLIEPQGLLVDRAGTVYVSDDKANVVLKLSPS